MLGYEGSWEQFEAGGTIAGLNTAKTLRLERLSGREVCGMRGVAVKCIDITQNPDCEGSIPAPYCR